MKVEVEIWQKVYERTTAIVDVPEEELVDYPEGKAGIEDYIMERYGDWMDTAYITHDEVLGPDGDSEVTVTVIEGAT